MKSYVSLTIISLKLALREKIVLFFNFLFPLIFFFVFGQMMDAGMGGVGIRVVSMVLVLGVLGNGLFGAGVRAVVDRETNILRRYKVTPITATPILVASIVTGWILYVPTALVVLGLANAFWGVEFPRQWPSLLALLTVGVWAMRAIGLIVASVVNSAAESNILIQLLYMPMLFLSGATFPLSALPHWAQIVSQFLPATYLHNGMERVLIRGEGLAENLTPAFALLACTVLATFISVKIFRWEKEEALPAQAKLWLVLVGLPFIALGVHQAFSGQNIEEAKALDRALSRNRTWLIRGARIFVGDGKVIEPGGVLMRSGYVAEVYEGDVPAPESLDAEVVEGAGKTVLPGLIDVHVHLAEPGGVPGIEEPDSLEKSMERSLAAYLYSGVTAVRSSGDPLATVLGVRDRIRRATRLGAELFACGPIFTSSVRPASAILNGDRPGAFSPGAREALLIPQTPDEGRRMVQELAVGKVDGVKVMFDGGRSGMRMDDGIFRAIAEESHARGLPLIVRTGNSAGVAAAIDAGAVAIEYGPAGDSIPGALMGEMKARAVVYDPALVASEARRQLAEGRFDLLSRSLVEQVSPPGMIDATRAAFAHRSDEGTTADPAIAQENLRRAYKAGVILAAGTHSGTPLLIHGPAIHRELQLWAEAGVPPAAVLAAATSHGAQALGASDRIGLIRPGYEASLLLVDGNPLEDIAATERISVLFFKGQRINRQELLAAE